MLRSARGSACLSARCERELSQHARANAADALKSAAQTLNRELEQRGGTKNPPSKMSSTVVLALVANRAATIAHLGDSRAYLIRAGRMSQLTRDHSVTQRLIDQGLMGASEAREHSSASVLTQALGQPGEVDIGISELELYHGDALLLCSDGLWAYASDGDIEAIASSSELSPGGVADALMHLALQGGGGDNVSVQFLRFSATQAPVVVPMRFLGVPARVALPLAAALAIAAAVGAGLTAWNLTHSPAAAASEPALSSFAADPSRPDSPRLAPVHVVVDNGARVRWIGGLRKLKDIPAMEIEPSRGCRALERDRDTLYYRKPLGLATAKRLEKDLQLRPEDSLELEQENLDCGPEDVFALPARRAALRAIDPVGKAAQSIEDQLSKP